MKVVDFHSDTLSELRHGMYRGEHIDFGKNNLQIDLKKLRKGDYLLQTFALFINLGDPYNPLVTALEQVDLFQQFLKEYASDIVQVCTMGDIRRASEQGKISALLSVEEGGCCLGNLSVLRVLHSLGVRVMTLTWNYENELAYPNQVPGDAAQVFPCAANDTLGLKPKGFEFIAEMERLGILIDVSHLSDAGFWDVYHHTTKPFIASHSNARALCPHVRNLTDDMIYAIAERGGLTGLNYCGAFLDPSENPVSRVKDMAKHAAYLRRVGGIDCIGLGSDFDGIEGDLELYDASCLPILEAELRKQRFTEAEIEKIFYRNALRVLSDILPED